jgi:hypothetical protein
MRRQVIGSILSMVLASPALADIMVGDTFYWNNTPLTAVGQVKLDSGLVANTNAAFGVTLIEGALTGSIYSDALPGQTVLFRTFCIEKTVYFTPGVTYWASIDPVAYSGAGGGGLAGDPIGRVTEYIYDQYLATKPTSSATLQAIRDAIWYSEKEIGSSNSVYNNAVTTLGAAASQNANHTYALNLWTITSQQGKYVATDVQSHLITMVPVPGAVLLGLLGLGYAGMRLRKRV